MRKCIFALISTFLGMNIFAHMRIYFYIFAQIYPEQPIMPNPKDDNMPFPKKNII